MTRWCREAERRQIFERHGTERVLPDPRAARPGCVVCGNTRKKLYQSTLAPGLRCQNCLVRLARARKP